MEPDIQCTFNLTFWRVRLNGENATIYFMLYQHYLIKGTILGKYLLKNFLTPDRIQRGAINIRRPSYKTPVILVIFE